MVRYNSKNSFVSQVNITKDASDNYFVTTPKQKYDALHFNARYEVLIQDFWFHQRLNFTG